MPRSPAMPGKRQQAAPPWWLWVEVTCSSCLAPHAHTLEVHCEACAVRACTACAVRVDGGWLCAACAGPRRGEER